MVATSSEFDAASFQKEEGARSGMNSLLLLISSFFGERRWDKVGHVELMNGYVADKSFNESFKQLNERSKAIVRHYNKILQNPVRL